MLSLWKATPSFPKHLSLDFWTLRSEAHLEKNWGTVWRKHRAQQGDSGQHQSEHFRKATCKKETWTLHSQKFFPLLVSSKLTSATRAPVSADSFTDRCGTKWSSRKKTKADGWGAGKNPKGREWVNRWDSRGLPSWSTWKIFPRRKWVVTLSVWQVTYGLQPQSLTSYDLWGEELLLQKHPVPGLTKVPEWMRGAKRLGDTLFINYNGIFFQPKWGCTHETYRIYLTNTCKWLNAGIDPYREFFSPLQGAWWTRNCRSRRSSGSKSCEGAWGLLGRVKRQVLAKIPNICCFDCLLNLIFWSLLLLLLLLLLSLFFHSCQPRAHHWINANHSKLSHQCADPRMFAFPIAKLQTLRGDTLTPLRSALWRIPLISSSATRGHASCG